MEFTPKRRLLAAIRGEEVDHVPFSPFLAYYFESLPREVQERGQLEYLKEMGADPLLRGFAAAYTTHHRACFVAEKKEGNKRYVTTHTPRGKLLGENGLHVALVGAEMKSAYQHLLEHLIGTENLIYLTMDYPDAVRELVGVIAAKNKKTVEYTAESKIEACLSWEDSSTTNLSPALYREYIAPEITGWNTMLNEAGKIYIQHACGHIKDLLLPIADQGITAIESISPPPTGNVTMAEAVEILPARVGLIGGIEPVQFLRNSADEFLEYVEKLCDTMKGRGFVLANSDSCPPGVQYDKFIKIAEFVKGNL